MKAEDFIAGAVTMPLKLPVLAKMDSIDDLARVVGAVNTITVTTDKILVGSNTDAAGIRDALKEVSETGRNLPGMVIGAGGASRAAIYALLGYLDCSAMYVVNRDPEKTKRVVAEMVARGFADAKEKIVVGCTPNNTPATQDRRIPRYSRGWVTIDGIEVLGLQLLEQRQLWLDPKVPLPAHAARQLMRDLSIGSASLNVSSSVGFNQTL
ncbi:NAD(P)-binding protein [Armillaria solidipes]|uniref:NAD(P)-binding protein n=1 Tax=Armillaria solidipes TaxID=1076256 RepID=A0A2H3BAP1_9AGAR|nr:NAD(P)-binding protein [Armillaria solidipes]